MFRGRGEEDRVRVELLEAVEVRVGWNVARLTLHPHQSGHASRAIFSIPHVHSYRDTASDKSSNIPTYQLYNSPIYVKPPPPPPAKIPLRTLALPPYLEFMSDQISGRRG